MNPFSTRVSDGLERRGLTLRQLCRLVDLDPSFFSKVLAGKRSPPADDVLRRIAAALELDAPELIVAAGRLPREWQGVWSDAELYRRVHALASGSAASSRPAAPARPAPAPARPASAPAPASRAMPARAELSEELL